MNRGPHLAVCNEFEGEYSLSWTAGHAIRAFEALGYKSSEPDWFCISVPAADLKQKAEQRLTIAGDRDARLLLAVANFALQKGGPGAEISAA
ncbi:hypothetical protein [Microvirga rosea]|uniref:hypothetical protein n=1 Tax=Microvirga rosea TaxID=2715425 RepID=UPI001D09EF0C|nr:hypothetical protein [Microvirga rosea]MCB8823313.1 hypothetical protein [Microvirga rosea]